MNKTFLLLVLSFIFFFNQEYFANDFKTSNIHSDSISNSLLKRDQQLQSNHSNIAPSKVEITNLPKSNYSDILINPIITILSVIIGAYIAWRLSERRSKKQDFENNLFKLLETQDEIRNSIIYEHNPDVNEYHEYKGELFFNWGKEFSNILYNYQKTFSPQERYRLSYSIQDLKNRESYKDFYENSIARKYKYLSDLEDLEIQREMAVYTYEKFFDIYYNQLGHYFRHLYRILKYIKRNRSYLKRYGEIGFYPGIIQARMSASELYFLFYNGLIFPKMKKLIEKYKLIENLAVEDLMEESHQNFYKCKMKSRKKLSVVQNNPVKVNVNLINFKVGNILVKVKRTIV